MLQALQLLIKPFVAHEDDNYGDRGDEDYQSLYRRRRSPSRQWLWQAAAVFASQVIVSTAHWGDGWGDTAEPDCPG